MPFDRMARLRSPLLSTAAIVAAGFLLWLGAIALWSRVALLDPAGFSERADAALDSESVREILAGEIVDQVSALGSSRVITVRPLAVFAVSEVMESRPFRAVFRRAPFADQRKREDQYTRHGEEERGVDDLHAADLDGQVLAKDQPGHPHHDPLCIVIARR